MQWSDAATIDLVQYCLARLSDLPLAWLLAARSGRSQARVVHRLERHELLEGLELGVLSPGEMRLLTQALLGTSELPEDVMTALYERTDGNPFLCVELLRTLFGADGSDQAVAVDGRWDVDALVPATVRDAIEDRADRLSVTARAALDWAAFLPEPFSFEELEAVGGAGVGDATEALADAGFLVSDEDRLWSFAHSIIRDAVYRRLPEGERVRRHGVVADALRNGPPERLAPQLEFARRWAEAAEEYLILGESALVSGQGEDAARLFERSEQLAGVGGDERLGRGGPPGAGAGACPRGAVDDARGGRQRRCGRSFAATPSRRAAQLPDALCDVAAGGARRARRGAEVVEEAEPLLTEAKGTALAEALATRSWIAMRFGEVGRALADAEQAAGLVGRGSDAAVEGRVLNSLGLAVGMSRSAAEGIEILERAAERSVEAHLPADAARVLEPLLLRRKCPTDTPAMEESTSV